MAASSASAPQGHQCEFIDTVPEDFYCKKCSLVARKLTFTSCCGESYCNACIQQDNQPCPGCGTFDFKIQQQVKYQKKILTFRVLCSQKKRGCDWCGALEHLDAHLDPDTGDCEYTDIDCPLKCHNKIKRKDIDFHIDNNCVKRDYVCPYCAFKDSYETICNIHWPECSYFPLICPNRCGVTCERIIMEEDHVKICPLQVVECKLKYIGCAERFPREEEEEHMREKAQEHLLMMAATSVKMSQDFQGRLQEQERNSREQGRNSQEQQRKLQEQETKSQEQERKLQEQERKLHEQERKLHEQETKSQEQEMKLQEQGNKLHEQETKSEEQEMKLQKQEGKSQKQERKLQEQEGKSQEQERKLHEQKIKLQEQEKKSQVQKKKNEHKSLEQGDQQKKLQDQEKKFEEMLQMQRKDSAAEHGQLKTEVADLKRMCLTRSRSFTMDDFSIEKAKGRSDDWKSPPMYTHVHGYKFCIGVDANGHGLTEGKSVNVELWVMEGEYDDKLKWPVTARFTLELVNHFDHGENKKCTLTVTWKKPNDTECLGSFNTVENTDYHFIYHRELPRKVLARTHFLKNDSLCFEMTKITIVGRDRF